MEGDLQSPAFACASLHFLLELPVFFPTECPGLFKGLSLCGGFKVLDHLCQFLVLSLTDPFVLLLHVIRSIHLGLIIVHLRVDLDSSPWWR